jgi:hypothetical protein
MFRPEPLATALLRPREINQALRKSYRLITIESLKGRILYRTTPAEERGMKFQGRGSDEVVAQTLPSMALLAEIGGQHFLRGA